MIALDEYIDPETININNPVLFRGKDCFFWQKKMFAGCTGESCIYTKCIQDNKGVDGVHFLVLFNPHTFLKISPDGIKEIINRLRSIFKEKRPLARGQEPIFSLSGYPFFAIHPETYEKLKPDPVHSNSFSLFNKLTANVTMLPMDTPYQTLNRKNDFLSIENFIHQFQAFELLGNGVIIEDYHNFYLEGIIPIGSGTRIAPGVVIKGESKIGKNSVLYPHVYLENSVIGDNCTVLPGCIITQSTLENNVQVGPYTHLRMNALVKEGAKMGNFVEMKKSTLGKGSKAMHLSYIGDAEIGEKVNIGAGTITCNYDGVNKHKTIIEDHVFIGSGTELVAPVTVRNNSYVAAGSTITEEVPAGSLGVARGKQSNIVGWVNRKRKK